MKPGGARSMAKLARAGLVAIALTSALTTGCRGSIDGGPTRDDGQPRAYAPAPVVLPRLTADQYRATLEDVLGEELPAVALEADTNPYLFYNVGATTTTLSEVGTQQYEEAAHAIAATMIDDPARRDRLVGCTPSAPGDACVQGFLARIGARLFRRPLEAADLARWVRVSTDLAAGDPWRGVRLALAGMLQSPRFLYRVELGVLDASGESRSYDGFEMASRLSFLLWNAGPDQELLDAAAAGDLDTPEGRFDQASRLLEDPRARRAIRAFFAQYFDLGRLDGLDRDPARYPLFTETLAASMRTELELVVDDVVSRRDADFRELFRTRRTFVNDELAALYDVEAEGASPITFVPVTLPDEGRRAGILTFAAYLAMNAHPTETSPTLRGKFVRERILCELVQPPPDDIPEIDPPDPVMPRTLRERLVEHRANPVCASCHAAIDPPGFVFEGFDSIGVVRTHDSGYPVDTSGDLDGIPLRDGRDLGEVLAEDPRVTRCVVRQLVRHATGHIEVPAEEEALRRLHGEFASSGFRFRELLLALAASDYFARATPGSAP
jgi:hypothetical protein